MNTIGLIFLNAISIIVGIAFGLVFREWFFDESYWLALGNSKPLGVIPILITLMIWCTVMIYTCVIPLVGEFAPEAETKAALHVMGSLCFAQLAAAIAVQAYVQPLDMMSPMVALWLLPMFAIVFSLFSI